MNENYSLCDKLVPASLKSTCVVFQIKMKHSQLFFLLLKNTTYSCFLFT